MDSRGPEALEANRNHERDGGESAEDGAFQADDFGREGLRGKVPGLDSDSRFVHYVGDFTADEVVPWEIA